MRDPALWVLWGAIAYSHGFLMCWLMRRALVANARWSGVRAGVKYASRLVAVRAKDMEDHPTLTSPGYALREAEWELRSRLSKMDSNDPIS